MQELDYVSEDSSEYLGSIEPKPLLRSPEIIIEEALWLGTADGGFDAEGDEE